MFTDAHGSVVPIFDGVVSRNPKHGVVHVDSLGDGAANFDGTQAGV